ncbi:hypothetical protein MMC10_000210 [Thelotrema lepadinum]|nr:hypothetical protein [Thelotrema lepadinum]
MATDDDWMSIVVTKHVSEYHQKNKALRPWIAINLTSASEEVSFEAKPDARVVRHIRKKLRYGTSPSDKLLTVHFGEVKEKTYLSRAADYCTWNSRKCVFKRIEFDYNIETQEREIRNREALMDHIDRDIDAQDYETEMEKRFNVVPILAVVVHGEQHPDQEISIVVGFLMPFTGDSLEVIAEMNPASQLPITVPQLWDLVRGIRELGLCGILHGDICFWNTILQQETSVQESNGAARLLLIDLGDVAPEYDGDAKALGSLFFWCLEHATALGSIPEAR